MTIFHIKILIGFVRQYCSLIIFKSNLASVARPSGGLITIFHIKLSKFSETGLQFDNFHIITFDRFNEQVILSIEI